MSLSFYYHPLASYCHKVLIALYELETDFDKRLINLGDPDSRAELAAVWPLAKFPVLRDHERQRDLPESSVIIEYLDHYYPGTAPLIPRDWDSALEVRLWDRFFDNHVQTPMQAIVSHRLGGGTDKPQAERSALGAAYGIIDQRMATRRWAGGDAFSMADCAAAPALFYALTLEPLPPALNHATAYVERLMERPSVRRVLEEAKPYFQYYPFAEAIPPRFR